MSAAEEQPKSTNKPKLIVGLIVIVAAVSFMLYQRQQGASINAYNQIIEEKFNQGHYGEAASLLEQMRNSATGELKQSIDQTLVQCYQAMAQDPANSLKQSADLLRKAQAIDPNALTEQEKKIVELNP